MRIVKWVIGLIIVGALINFMLTSFVKSSKPPQVAKPPVLPETPARVYGKIEPAGREVYVSPPMTKRVVAIYVKEGDMVKKGQALCSLESEVETAQVNLTLSKIESAKKMLEITQDDFKRKKNLYVQKTDSEFSYTQSRLKSELDANSIAVAELEAQLAKAQLEELQLKSPVDGMVYKFDVRLGETLAAGDNTRIILGAQDLWVRLFVESYWLDRVKPGSQYKVYNSETNKLIGSGKVVFALPYVGRRDFRTEDSQERFDTKFQEVVLALDDKQGEAPIGLSVMAVLEK
ncbi:MAG: efflux RND transporter periplasmic adaptor subunit [Proteobacteria bacterium]|nr:efflux RND transporter periplasmic adaptor subunit [Pseudomonadota bacterium]